MVAVTDMYTSLGLTHQAAPFLKWPGGKRDIAEIIGMRFPSLAGRTYREPFLGGGAMFFYLEPERAVLSDALPALVDTWRTVRGEVDALIRELAVREREHREAARLLDDRTVYDICRRAFNANAGPRLIQAARFIYLNKTCFNGLCRFNRRGEFNAPYGKNGNPTICDPDALRAASAALRSATILCDDFELALADAAPGDVVYLDSPYVPLSATSSFVGYAGTWRDEDHDRLAGVFRDLDQRRCLLIMSNSDTPRTRALYAGFDIEAIDVRRSIGASADSRTAVGEVIVRNTARWPR